MEAGKAWKSNLFYLAFFVFPFVSEIELFGKARGQQKSRKKARNKGTQDINMKNLSTKKPIQCKWGDALRNFLQKATITYCKCKILWSRLQSCVFYSIY